MKWDAVVSSDLQRAKQTADVLADALGIPVLSPDTRLRERFYGEVEGTTAEERLAKWGADWKKRDSGQENDKQLRERALSFVEDAAGANPNRNLLVVTHGSLLAQLLQAMCAEWSDKPINNLSFSILERAGAGWAPILHNCTLHLEQLHQQ